MVTEKTFEDRVREKAHALWEEAGCPNGQAEQNWLRAEYLVMAESERAGFGDEESSDRSMLDGPLRPS